ncbi:haloalkane dehalogenase [Alphaproteobacteria bacterium]|nr:haloalkane dehalogenase [Alphaproteobacteria bacterium]
MTFKLSNKPYGNKKSISIDSYNISYIEVGEGDPIIFIHGNPTSSYIWRNIMPFCEGLGRLIAPDLIGMGDSDKLLNSGVNSYSLSEHEYYLDNVLHKLNVDKNVTLVLHDWGTALGFEWARKNYNLIKSIIYMEAVLPISWENWPESAVKIFKGFRSKSGEEMILDKNLFIEAVLPNSIIRNLDQEEISEYRRPYINSGEDRRPTLSWPRQIPIDSEPKEILEKFNLFLDWMKTNNIPKLFINGEPGSILVGEQREFCRSWLNQKEATVKGLHFLQEDSPVEIGRAIKKFITEINH